MSLPRKLLVALSFLLLPAIHISAPSFANTANLPNQVTVEFSRTSPPIGIKQGFLNGFPFNNAPLNRVRELQPQFWRVSDLDRAAYLKKQFPDIKITFVFVDWYANQRKNHWSKTNWKRWDQADYEATLKQTVAKGADIVDYWDTWPEPDWSFKGKQAQLHDIYIRTHNAIRSIKPDAKIIGPDLSKWSPQIIKEFLKFCANNNLRFDVISWHENGMAGERPELVGEHVAIARKYMREINGICAPSCPEISINEFSAPQNHLVPGWTLAWLAAFEAAGVESVARACWDTTDDNITIYSDCWKGLNGLLTADGKLTKPLYWVHRKYARRNGALTLKSALPEKTDDSTLTVLGAYIEKDKTIQILLGRHSCGKNGLWCMGHGKPVKEEGGSPISVKLNVNGLPESLRTLTYEIQKIPNTDPATSLAAPVNITNGSTNPVKGKTTLKIDDLGDGEVIEVLLKIADKS